MARTEPELGWALANSARQLFASVLGRLPRRLGLGAYLPAPAVAAALQAFGHPGTTDASRLLDRMRAVVRNRGAVAAFARRQLDNPRGSVRSGARKLLRRQGVMP